MKSQRKKTRTPDPEYQSKNRLRSKWSDRTPFYSPKNYNFYK